MAVTVLDSSNLVEAVTTGKIPVPPGIAEDNAAQAAKRDAAKPGGEPKPNGKETGTAAPGAAAAAASTAANVPTRNDDIAKLDDPDDPDNVPGDDGLTPREKRIFTPAMQRTIAKKFRAQREAEAFATTEYNGKRLAEENVERLRRENEALKRQLNPPAAAATDDNASPKRTDFQTDSAYQEALIDYRVDQKLKAQQAEEAQRREELAQQELIQRAAAKVERAIELVPDFKEVTEAIDMEVPPHIAGYMQESDLFAELGYHFAKNPEVLEKLSEMTAGLKPDTPAFVKGITRSLVELGKIESKIQPFAPAAKVDDSPNGEEPSRTNGAKPSTETGSAPSKPRVSAPIIRPLNAGSAGQVGKDEKDMKPSEVINHWERKHGIKLTARKRH